LEHITATQAGKAAIGHGQGPIEGPLEDEAGIHRPVAAAFKKTACRGIAGQISGHPAPAVKAEIEWIDRVHWSRDNRAGTALTGDLDTPNHLMPTYLPTN